MFFIDVRNSWGNVPIKKLFEVLDQSHIAITSIKTIKSLYRGMKTRIKVGNIFQRNLVSMKDYGRSADYHSTGEFLRK